MMIWYVKGKWSLSSAARGNIIFSSTTKFWIKSFAFRLVCLPFLRLSEDASLGSTEHSIPETRNFRKFRERNCPLGFFEAMKIKEIIIDGFKSYANRTVISGWDESFNAITGLNGTGKSNILDSICFVLGISNLSQVRVHNLQEVFLYYSNSVCS